MDATTWPGTVLILGLSFLALILLIGTAATVHEFRKLKISATVQEDLRQLVRRYEQLAENTMDAQQRMSTDLSDVRSRTTSIEQILRTVE
ncbi:hypothetical protein ABT352_02760 [Streptosporangium sp. NPDC000563]|uniref:hypothetical protein n=1 Tax=Streptosporangium sp. NPDC000563 TaxID=3154366 RepID=UPI0033264CCB